MAVFASVVREDEAEIKVAALTPVDEVRGAWLVAIGAGSPDLLAVRDFALFSAVRKSDFRKFDGAGPSWPGDGSWITLG